MNSLPTLSITNMMYGWTKWGGGRMGMAKEELDEWYCQVCREKQTRDLPSYMIPLDADRRDWARVCSFCKAKANTCRVELYWELVEVVKRI